MPTSLPIVGKGPKGKPVTGYATGITPSSFNSTSNMSASLKKKIGEWKFTEVCALYQSDDGIVGVGYGVDKLGKTQNLIWKFKNNKWLIGSIADLKGIKPAGVNFHDGSWLFAKGTDLLVSKVALRPSAPAGDMPTMRPAMERAGKSAIKSDSITSSASTVISTSASVTGTDIPAGAVAPAGSWPHYSIVQNETCHYDTWYSFPGYSGANPQFQFANAVVNGTAQPTQWYVDKTVLGAEGYYGVVADTSTDPSVTVTWTTYETRTV